MSERRFSATQQTTINALRNTMTKMKASSLKINQDIMDGNVDIIFDRNGRRYKFSCRKYPSSLDNMRAVQLSIEYLYRALESYGVFKSEEQLNRIFDSFFLGFEATPDDSVLMIGNSTQWWEILGVEKNCKKDDVRNAYRALSKIHHPDFGGNKDNFLKIKEAYEKGLIEVKE